MLLLDFIISTHSMRNYYLYKEPLAKLLDSPASRVPFEVSSESLTIEDYGK